MESLTARFYKEVFIPYLNLLKAEYRFHPIFDHAKDIWEEKLTEKELVNGPYLEKSQIYESGELLDVLPLDNRTIETIHIKLGAPNLYKHQTDALKLLLSGKNAVITTGTSSGKTLCFQVPILDDLIRDPSPGLRAIIIYPLNALVNDQLCDWEQLLKNHPNITFARFTGQTPYSFEEYVSRLRESIRQQLIGEPYTQQQLKQEIERQLEDQLQADPPNRLNHRDVIRTNPPHVLITNFSMLEYLLERPIDSPIFENSRLKFLVLDEAHAYRGVQATEIAFLIRRLKDRLALETMTCIATSATLGNQDNEVSKIKVRKYVSDLFGDEFLEPNPIYGTPAEPILEQPSFCPKPSQYIDAVDSLRKDDQADIRKNIFSNYSAKPLAHLLSHDENLYRLRKEILVVPTPLNIAAKKLWPNEPTPEEGLQALLEIVSIAMQDEYHMDLLPTRLHYFVRAQDGLHICLHRQCPGRRNGKAAFFVSRKNDNETPEGECPDCYRVGIRSKLVEIVTCRKCGYLYGALQDIGPRRAQNPENDEVTNKPYFDSFTTELGWSADSYWSYFSVEDGDELPYPPQPEYDEDGDEQLDLFAKPAALEWCVICGKKKDAGAGYNCSCENPHPRNIKIFHRQCPHYGKPKDLINLYDMHKKQLIYCPNCGARNASGLEPVRRFQESDDETGLAMAIPLSHFQISPHKVEGKLPRKLLCFTDHRQRAAAFPSLLEEETFAHDMGRQIVRIIQEEKKPIDFISLGEHLADIGDAASNNYDPDFFLPVSRFPDEELDAKQKRDLWVSETFSYFAIPDSARESAEDLGLVKVEYRINNSEKETFHSLLDTQQLSLEESTAALQVLLGFMRQRKAFTLPKGRVEPDAPAFGRVTADIAYVLRRQNDRNTIGWLPRHNGDNTITNYLKRLLILNSSETLILAEKIWDFLTSNLLINIKGKWKLDHERLYVANSEYRYICNRCGIITAYSACQCCIRKECVGNLEARLFNSSKENIIAQWVSGQGEHIFTTLKSEEHTAQINKDLAKEIEDEFRTEGVNLLSSTTTFEMGINIGNLQKVLLRNAPPTSASYVQRVGRVGRGKDKNSVCVTLCRRTKYDADAWNNPPRLMSGEVRTPTVFIKNKYIAQRHFNAVVFAKFLKFKIQDEHALGKEIKQQIRLEVFLPPDSKVHIPENWFRIRPVTLFLNFLEWLELQKEEDIFVTQGGLSLTTALAGFNHGKERTHEKYNRVLEEISGELIALVEERKKLYNKGLPTGDIELAIKNLIGSDIITILAKRGFLPRYAFPLDVVTLETGLNRWLRDSDVELSRDRGIAIAEFAPSAQVIAHKKVFTSAGLYVVSKTDKPERKWYSKCPGCEQIRTSQTKDSLKGDCPVCQRLITDQWICSFVEPEAFSVQIDSKTEGAARHRRSTLIRQRQALTHFIDSVEEINFKHFGLFRLVLMEEGKLFRYNLGPANKGFMLCQTCGYSEPLYSYKFGKKHKRLRPLLGSVICENENPWTKPIAYGHQFQSFCLIARPVVPVISIESLAYALQKGLCLTLDIEPSDIGVSWRWLANKSSRIGTEIILYDNTHGGAGFVKEGYDNWEQVVNETQVVCEKCTCELACYDCLKSYGNQSHHEKLSRLSVAEFFKT